MTTYSIPAYNILYSETGQLAGLQPTSFINIVRPGAKGFSIGLTDGNFDFNPGEEPTDEKFYELGFAIPGEKTIAPVGGAKGSFFEIAAGELAGAVFFGLDNPELSSEGGVSGTPLPSYAVQLGGETVDFSLPEVQIALATVLASGESGILFPPTAPGLDDFIAYADLPGTTRTEDDVIVNASDNPGDYRLGRGDDYIETKGGDDTVNAGSGDDTVRGGADNDVLFGRAGNDLLVGNQGKDTLVGNGGDDVMLGGTGADVLKGGRGDDVLSGDRGNDTIRGGAGDDRLLAEKGLDVLFGGAGADTFILLNEIDRTTIRDFDAAEGDMIDVTLFASGFSSKAAFLRQAIEFEGSVVLLAVDFPEGDAIRIVDTTIDDLRDALIF